MLTIRPATVDDVSALVEIHITSWKAQFIPFLTPEQVKLKDLETVSYSKLWQERLEQEEGETRLTFITERDNTPVAYITGRDTETHNIAELHQIYVHPSLFLHQD